MARYFFHHFGGMFEMVCLNINYVVYIRFTLEILRNSFKDCGSHSLEQLKLRYRKPMWLLIGRDHGQGKQCFQNLSPKLKVTRTDIPNCMSGLSYSP